MNGLKMFVTDGKIFYIFSGVIYALVRQRPEATAIQSVFFCSTSMAVLILNAM